ncbi:MAG: CoxG family protein [Limnohabitans sp.]|jgi:carbon monoxide dehydrogenase subunit G|nr:carbon monoxide dehydrogenase subunit G [Burkholderiales bacterium]
MDMQGQRILNVTQAQAWAALNDPEILKACIPGCEKFEVSAENIYNVGVAIKIGPVSAKFSGKVSLSDIQAPTSYALQFEAQGGVAGFGKGESKVALQPHADGCELNYSVHSTVGGKLAQLGQRLIDGAAKSLAEDFFKRFEKALQDRYPAAQKVDSTSDTIAASAHKIPTWTWLALAVAMAAVWTLAR